ncbi:hypothetical protein ACWKW4_08105 [Hydrogenophaga borbori]
MSSLKAQLELAADASGVETGVSKAKRSLKDLGATAQAAGAQSAAGIDKVPLATGRAAKAIDRIVEKYQTQAQTLKLTTSETALFELRQRGASRAQLDAAAAALKAVDAHNAQEAALSRTKAVAEKFAAVLATLSVTALVGFAAAIRRSVADIDAFNDLKDATGASIEGISALDRVARETGGTFDQVSSILTKFNQALKDVDSNKRIGAVFKALNLDVAELKRLDPAEALRRTAVALSTFADDGGKARAVQELFGRSVREIAPLLKDLSEKTSLVASTTTEAAAEAEKLGKNLSRLRANIEDVSRSLAGRLVPVLNQVIEDVTSFRSNAGLASLASDVITLKKELDALQARKGSPFNFAQDLDAQIAEASRKLEQAKARFNAADVNRPKSAGGGRGFVNPAFASTLPSLEVPEQPTGTKGDPLAEAKRYLESLQKQIEKTRELTVYEQALADISQKRLGKLTPELERSILATARQVDVSNQAKAALEGMTTARQRAAEMLERADNAALASVQQQIEGNQALRDEIELIGLSVTARAAVEQARLSSAIALKEEELAMARNAEASAAQISALEREIALLKERQGLLGERGRRVAAVEARDRAKEFSDGVRDDLKRAFSDAFRDTKNPIKAFGESLYNTISARVASALAESLATKALGFLGLSIAGARAEGGPVSAGKTYLVGERGMELFTPNTSGTITSNEDLAGAMASRSGPNVVVHQNFTVGDVATISMVRQAVAGSEARIASSLSRSVKYGGSPV